MKVFFFISINIVFWTKINKENLNFDARGNHHECIWNLWEPECGAAVITSVRRSRRGRRAALFPVPTSLQSTGGNRRIFCFSESDF